MEAPISASLGAMGSLLGKLDVLLAPEYRLPKEAKDGIQLLRGDLQEIATSLVDLSEAEDPPLTAKCWMKDVREQSYDMEDYVDELLHSGADAKAGTVRRGGRFKIGRLPWTMKRQPLITNRVSEFRSHVQEAIQRHERYNLGDCISRRRHLSVGPMLPTEYTETDDLFDGPRNELLKWLTNEEEQQLKVASIVGSGGLGKTTLARKLYHKLGGRFDCRAFLHTSQKPDMKRLLGGMLSQLRHHHQPPDACEVPELIHTIRTHLHDKRYLIVMDDLWATSLWNSICPAFPEGNHCSRIITTTQIEEVALTCCSYHQDYILKMKRLDMDQSRKLFFKRVFGSENDCPQQFRGISLGIIKRCGGLPLAIISIASLLASQPVLLMEQWVYIHDSLLASNLKISTSEGMRQVLNLSYDNLPHHLKTCLLYLNTYPEDYTILKDDLVKQWVAEGFINAIEGQDSEEVAGSYFDELVHRRMIQPMDTNYKHEVFKVHGMLLDLIAYKSMEDNFSTAVDYSQNTIGFCDKVRRLSFHFGSAKYAKTPASIGLSQVRSLAFFGLFKSMPPITQFNLLRVLILQIWGDCGGTSADLTRICELHQLRYLQIACDVNIEIPTLMQRLQCLETVEIYARLTTVPLDIVHLPRLLHLCLPGETNLLGSVGHMRSLRRLGYLDLGSNSFDTVRSLGELTNLRDLHLACCTVPSDHLESNMQCLGSILGKLGNLKSLTLVSNSHANILVPCHGLSFVSPVPCLLQRLELLPRICIFSSLPKWIGGLGELCTLKIAVRELRRNDVDTLKRLSTLTILSLCVKEAPLQRITFHSMEFPVLRYFKFRCREACLTFEEGAMPNLRRLKLGFNAHGAEQHSRMPTGLENLLSLEELTARIGHRGAMESDRRAAESALTTMIGVHRRCPGVNIFWVDWIFNLNESISRRTQEEGILEEEHGILEIEPDQEYGIVKRDEKQKYYMDEEGDTRISMPSGSHTSNLASADIDYSLEEDEQLAPALQESLNTESPLRQNVPSESVPAKEPPPHIFPSSGIRTCAGCKNPIGHGRFLSCMDSVWHPQCFRCFSCDKPISEYEFAMHEDRPYHKTCYKEIFHPKCHVCKNFIPTNRNGLIEFRAHSFWMQMYCPSHEVDGTPRCCSCERMEPMDTKYITLDDGRKLCLECFNSAIMDTPECQHLYMDIQEFFEGLNMKIEQQVPLLIVERQALNEAMEGEKSGHHLPETRGLCLSEEQIVRTILRRPIIGPGNRMIDMITGAYRLVRRSEVTAILILYGLPRLLTGSILAHEMTHAYLRLKGYRSLSPEVEEGICQVLSHMWLESEIISGSSGNVASTSVASLSSSLSSSSTPTSSKKGAKTDLEKKLGEFFKHQIEADHSVTFGDGFRAGIRAVERNGLRSNLDHIRMTGSFLWADQDKILATAVSARGAPPCG